MRQVARRLKDGQLSLVEVPSPVVSPGAALVRLEASVLSAGTERATLDVARKGLIAKARSRPDQARQVLDRARQDGIRATTTLVRDRLEALGPLGYSAAGTVLEAGPETSGIGPGDRVAIAGGGFANHAEIDHVPSLLCTRIPDGVSSEDGAFATLGAIALNGFRRANVEVGSTVAVIGLGLIGQLAVRLARAAGCRVYGVDLKPHLVELATQGGAEAILRHELDEGSRWMGSVDAVLICAAARSDDPVRLAGSLARERGRVVVVGDVEMNVPRAPFYEKELDLRLARSYGPGRYDPNYELHGIDYPIGHVRWTQQRNLEAFLGLVADGKVAPGELVTHSFPFAEAEAAFAVLDADEPVVGIVLKYGEDTRGRPAPPAKAEQGTQASSRPAVTRRRAPKPRFGLVGPGSFATGTLIPGLAKAGLEPALVASASGLTAESARKRFGFEAACSSAEEMLETGNLDLLVVATQHDSHANLATLALEAAVPVYVEKPLALNWEQLRMVADAQRQTGVPVFVGFNRRHAPAARAVRELPGPKLMSYRVNAGPVPAGHWLNDPARGGGRLIGEGCHFVDFICDQTGSDPLSVHAQGFRSNEELALAATDNYSLQIRFADGSVGTVHYAADAARGPGKERFEVSAPGAFAAIDDFRQASIWQGRSRRQIGGRQQDKGFSAQFAFVAEVITGKAEAPPFESFLLPSLTTLAAVRSLEAGHGEPIVDAGSDAAEWTGANGVAASAAGR